MRETGKTTKLIQKMRDNDVLVIHHANFKSYVEYIAVRLNKKIKVLTSEHLFNLRGISEKIFIDHHAYDMLDENSKAEIKNLNVITE